MVNTDERPTATAGCRQTAYHYISHKIRTAEQRLSELKELAAVAEGMETDSPAERALLQVLLEART